MSDRHRWISVGMVIGLLTFGSQSESRAAMPLPSVIPTMTSEDDTPRFSLEQLVAWTTANPDRLSAWLEENDWNIFYEKQDGWGDGKRHHVQCLEYMWTYSPIPTRQVAEIKLWHYMDVGNTVQFSFESASLHESLQAELKKAGFTLHRSTDRYIIYLNDSMMVTIRPMELHTPRGKKFGRYEYTLMTKEVIENLE